MNPKNVARLKTLQHIGKQNDQLGQNNLELVLILLGGLVILGLCMSIVGKLIPHSPTMTVGLCIFLIAVMLFKTALYSMYFRGK